MAWCVGAVSCLVSQALLPGEVPSTANYVHWVIVQQAADTCEGCKAGVAG